MQVIVDIEACVSYMAKYATKAEHCSKPMSETFQCCS